MSIALSPPRPKAAEKYPAKRVPPPLERNAPSQKHRQTARASPIFFSDQYKIRSPVTKNPPSRNRKPHFVSPRRQPLCPFGHADVSPWPQPRSGLMSLCSYVLLFSALAAASPRYGASPYVSCCLRRSLRRYICFLCSLCSYVSAVSAMQRLHTAPALMPLCLRVSGLSPNP